MSEHVDQETGEVRPNGNGIGYRASSAAAQAHVQMKNQLNALGASGLHFAVWQAVQQLPVWIKTDREGARSIKYATLKAILEAVRPPLMTAGVRIRQGADRTFGTDDGSMKGRLVPVYTDLIHVPTGEFERTQIEIPLIKLDPQSMGSAITYGRRYTLIAALGLATDEADDDGASAMPRDIHAKSEDSSEVAALKAEIDKQKDIESITKWATLPANRARLNRLDDAETERVRSYYTMKREKLSTAE